MDAFFPVANILCATSFDSRECYENNDSLAALAIFSAWILRCRSHTRPAAMIQSTHRVHASKTLGTETTRNGMCITFNASIVTPSADTSCLWDGLRAKR